MTVQFQYPPTSVNCAFIVPTGSVPAEWLIAYPEATLLRWWHATEMANFDMAFLDCSRVQKQEALTLVQQMKTRARFIVVMDASPRRDDAFDFFEAGCVGYGFKYEEAYVLVKLLRKFEQGKLWLDGEFTEGLDFNVRPQSEEPSLCH